MSTVKRVLHVAMGINPVSGGPTRSTKGICRALSRVGIEVSLLVLHGNDKFDNPCGVKVYYGGKVNFSDYDIVHIHGLWDPALHRVAKQCRRERVKYIISPRGMLDPWALSVKKWKKRMALLLYQRNDLQKAAAFHATAEAEARHIKAQHLWQPVIISPNAVDLPDEMPKRTHVSLPYSHSAIFVSRLHPGKGLLTLADAWAIVSPVGWQMVVVGPDSYGHRAEVEKRLNKLGIVQDWKFVDGLDDVKKWEAYRSADLLVHPSVSENFGITIAEGLAAELPTIATKGTPWQELETRKCGWWIETGVEPLAAALKEAMALSDEERVEMGKRGRSLVEAKYTWDAVVTKLVNGYDNVLAQSC